MDRTKEFLTDLGRALGDARRNLQLSEGLYQAVHAAVEREKYGGWQLPDDEEEFDGDYSRNTNDNVTAFVQGWLAGSHNTDDPERQCTLGMCGCSVALPDRPAITQRSPAAMGVGVSVDGLIDAGVPLAELPGLASEYVHQMAARCNRCSQPVPNGYCTNPFCKGTFVTLPAGNDGG